MIINHKKSSKRPKIDPKTNLKLKKVWRKNLEKKVEDLETTKVQVQTKLTPYWNDDKKEISDKLYLPNNLEEQKLNIPFSSIFNPLGKKKIKTPKIEIPDISPEKGLKSLKIKIFPTPSEKIKIAKRMEMFRWYYNMAKTIFEDEELENTSFISLRNKLKEYEYQEKVTFDEKRTIFVIDNVKVKKKKSFYVPDFFKDVYNERIVRGAVKNFVTNMKSALSNKRNGNIKKFELSYRTKKDKKYMLLFEDNHIPADIRKIKGYYKCGRKKIPIEKIWKNIKIRCCIMTHDRMQKRYYIHLPVDYDFNPRTLLGNTESQSTPDKVVGDKVISLDAGVRTFMTGYSPNGEIIELGKDMIAKIQTYYDRIDTTQKKLDKKPNKKRKQYYRRRKITLYKHIINLVTNFQWQIINFLTNRYKVILLSDFKAQQILKRHKLCKKTQRLLSILSFYKFKERLLYKCKNKGVYLSLVDESYTSKTCSRCGWINNKLGGNKVYVCERCNLEIDRDWNAGRGILVKNVDLKSGVLTLPKRTQ